MAETVAAIGAFFVKYGAAIAAGSAAVGAGAGIYTATQAGKGGPPKPPPYRPPPIPPPVKKETPPPKVPGIEENKIGAGAMDERRRILSGLPQATQTTYAGATSDAAPVKKRVLGGGYGKETTGE